MGNNEPAVDQSDLGCYFISVITCPFMANVT